MTDYALHGVNLTGWLSLESWVTPELFAGTGSLGEQGIIDTLGVELYQDLVEEHRACFITEEDFRLIARRGFNAVRIPVPWYVFGDQGPDAGPYVGCAQHVESALEWAERHGIAVLLVLDVSPGVDEDEVLITNTEWGRRDEILDVLSGMARSFSCSSALFGIEVASEPVAQKRKGILSISEGVPLHVLRNYYRDAYEAIRAGGGEEPCVVLPDAGIPGAWRSFMAPRRYHNVWLDCHLYHYADHVDATGPAGAAALVNRSVKTLARAQKSRLPVMVGAWSSALPFADSLMTPEGLVALERVYSAEQIAAFEELPGWFFQTWKTNGHLSGWDSRIALSSFERSMLG
ncbi:MAG: cellulase family glycosylhydrolase [Coriobacteriales bacterium]|nr:cellulase family glycosylhydrolase [Coriobacteriales bacterium]